MKPEHFPATPGVICTAILTALSALKLQNGGVGGGGTGCVRSIRRLHDDTEEAINTALTAGLPALLLVYRGGDYVHRKSDGQRVEDKLDIRVLCAAGSWESSAKRYAGGELDSSLATNPGVEDLQDWAAYLAIRAARAVSGVRHCYLKSHSQAVELGAGRWVAAVDMTCTRYLDVYDDTFASALAKLGIVGNPLDPNDLWTDQNDTQPNIADPATQQGGVVTL